MTTQQKTKIKLNSNSLRSIFNISWRDETVLAKKYPEIYTPEEWEKILKENNISYSRRGK